MYQLNEHQAEMIYDRLRQQGISNRRLEQDLLDHFCCFMEARLEQGADFEQAYEDAVAGISPKGLQEIEFELFFLLNFNKQLTMKKIIFSAGFFAAFLLSSGIMFKTLHWPGATIILFCGFALVLITALLTGLHLFRFLRSKSPAFWFRSVTGLAAVSLISLGFVFKIFHLTGSNILYGLGTIILNFVFLPVLFYHIYKHGLIRFPAQEAAS
jgi:hypothetical protein